MIGDLFHSAAAEQVIERRSAEALAEIERMGRAAREAIARRIAFYNRSQGQIRRFWRERQQKGATGNE